MGDRASNYRLDVELLSKSVDDSFETLLGSNGHPFSTRTSVGATCQG